MFRKAKKIIGKVLFVCLIVCCVLFVLYGAAHAFFHNIPISKNPVDVSLTVTKLDAAGEPVDTFPITIRGNIEEYLFNGERLNVYIEPFDGYVDFLPHNLNNVDGGIFDLMGLHRTRYYATGSEGFEYFDVYFSADCNRWAFVVEDSMYNIKGRYVASADPDEALQDLKDYFDGLLRTE